MRQHETTSAGLTAGRISRFWLPLEATWLMMAAEGPFLAALIARLAAPKENLAAFAVATALSWMVESPIIMMLSASNALVRDGVAYRKLRRFSWPPWSRGRSSISWPAASWDSSPASPAWPGGP
jgi:hypothetical protein